MVLFRIRHDNLISMTSPQILARVVTGLEDYRSRVCKVKKLKLVFTI